ncbi:uncharacterized protein N7482_000948 [Penicillium canariense]|uniref:Xylanolytic transcriptional activator regulatory domain-containing protein n=1 Tax=Penicillium canariense TaxID=189055 RepID=A0A9W9LSL7_9EURO|nr:uncharacterized protein N7482_000948 [Penicillium canariense]KAJ5175071.1 hypothetical protein N7482_000948 [Penicillium canariense]
METLICALNTRFLGSGDAQMDDLIFLGIIVRMAQRMGYHRDPSHFPHISPFQGEMRRRLWSLISDWDVLVSAQFGLPRLLREFQSDTAPPRNLLDDDFDEDIAELPPPRPSSFETPTQWLVAKNRLISMLGMITDFSTSIRRPAYAEVMRMDKLIPETYESTPSNLRERPMGKSLIDSSDIILRRIQLVLLLEKAKCVLHYRYLAPARTNEAFAFSRTTCIKSAFHVLDYKFLVDQETKPGGRLFKERWKTISPMFRGNFLLATTLLCLELNYHLSIDLAANPKQLPLTSAVVHQIFQALRRSYTIWIQLNGLSNESRKAVQALEFVFSKAQNQTRYVFSEIPMKASGSTNVAFSQAFRPSQPGVPEPESATSLDQAMDMSQMQPSDITSPFLYDNIAPELLDMTHSVDEMLGMSMGYPQLLDFPL